MDLLQADSMGLLLSAPVKRIFTAFVVNGLNKPNTVYESSLVKATSVSVRKSYVFLFSFHPDIMKYVQLKHPALKNGDFQCP